MIRRCPLAARVICRYLTRPPGAPGPPAPAQTAALWGGQDHRPTCALKTAGRPACRGGAGGACPGCRATLAEIGVDVSHGVYHQFGKTPPQNSRAAPMVMDLYDKHYGDTFPLFT